MNDKIILLALLAASSCCVSAQAPAGGTASWHQWRGPHRSGHCPGPAWPARLTKENLELQWRVPLGPSYSGPVVDATRVYSTETADRQHEVVRAFDRHTGQELWRTSWQGSMKVPFFASKNGSWIRSTPTIDGARLYVAGMRDVLACLDTATGKELWRVDFVQRFKTPLPDFGFVCSPLVHGAHVYVLAGASFVKLDKLTGKTVWRTLEDQGGTFGSAFSPPVHATLAGTEQLIVQTRTTLCGVDVLTGRKLWGTRVRAFRGMNILTPQPFGDGVFTSAYGGRAHFFDVARVGDSFEVKERWTNRAQGNMTSPVVIDGHAYLYLRSKRFACVDLEQGKVAWISEPIGDTYWSLVAQERRILALTDGGELCLIEADPKAFRIMDRVQVSESSTWAHLAVDQRQLLVRELDGLVALRWNPPGAGTPRTGG